MEHCTLLERLDLRHCFLSKVALTLTLTLAFVAWATLLLTLTPAMTLTLTVILTQTLTSNPNPNPTPNPTPSQGAVEALRISVAELRPGQAQPALQLLLRPMAACPPNHPTRRNLDRKLDLAAAPGFVKPGSKPSPPRARGGGGVKGWFARGRQGGVLAYLGLQGEPILY